MRTSLFIGLIGGTLFTAGFGGAGYYAFERFEEGSIEQKAQKALAFLEGHGLTIELGAVSGEALSGTVTADRVKIELPDKRTIEAERLTIERFDYRTNGFPRFAAFQLAGVSVKSDIFGAELAKLLGEAKIADLAIDASFAYEYDAKARTLHIAAFRIAARNVGTVTLAAKLGDWRPDPRAQAGRLGRERSQIVRQIGERATIAGGTVRFEDGGFYKAYVAGRAESIGKNEAAARAEMTRDLQREFRDRKDAVSRDAVQTLLNFMRKPQAIALIVAPPKPVELRRIEAMLDGNRAALREQLGVKFELR